MNPLRLTASNLRSYPSVDFAIPEGITALIGANGAGKSTLLGGIELCLFAEGAKDLAPALGPFAERMELALEFEHGGERYRVRRSYTSAGRGKATLDFESYFDTSCGAAGGHSWETLTKENAAATQAHLERTLGLSRATFNASAFLAQGNSGAFPEASPADRKALLGAILDPAGAWPARAEKARAESRAAEQAIAADQARLQDREELAADVPALHKQLDVAEMARSNAADAAKAAEAVLEQALARQAQAEAAAERLAGAKAAKEAAHTAYLGALEAVRQAAAAAEALQGADPALARLEAQAAEIDALEQDAVDRQNALRLVETARLEKTSAVAATERAQQRASDAQSAWSGKELAVRDAAERRAQVASGALRHCDRCEQPLGAQAKAAALRSLSDDLDLLVTQRLEADQEFRLAKAEVVSLSAAAEAIEIPAAPSGADPAPLLAAARGAATEAAALRGRCEAWEREAARLPALQTAEKEAAAALSTAEQALIRAQDAAPDTARLDGDVAVARDRQRQARERLEQAHAATTALQGDLARARDAAEQARELRRQLAAAQERLGTLRLAERAFGRDGIPALIAENTCGVIKAEANRVLEQMPAANGAALRVGFRTLRALKTDASALKETLDILVADQQSQREFLTFSGGERFRVSFALRWALARLLAGRRGADSRLLVVDEPDGLDAAGMDGLARVLRAEGGGFERVLVVSHNPLLAEAFEQVVRVESDGQVSRVAA